MILLKIGNRKLTDILQIQFIIRQK